MNPRYGMQLPSCWIQHRLIPLTLALVALFACDRRRDAVPSDAVRASVDTIAATPADTPPVDTEPTGRAPLPETVRAPVRVTRPPRAASKVQAALDTPAVSAPSPGIAAPAAPLATAPAESATAATSAAPPPPPPEPAPAPSPARPALPFKAGEKLTYDVRFGPLKVGTATMEVSAVETMRGREVFHTTFRIKGGTLGYKVNDRYESWFDTQSLVSLRYRQDIDEGSYERERIYEIFPERAVYSENGKPEQASVTEPLDDGSFIYFIRSIPLEVGQTYTFHRYFRPDRNPVTIRVLRRERVRVPAGSFQAIVVRPVIKAKGIFSEGGRAELWLADDSTRVMLQLQSKLSFGSLNLYLTSIRRP